LVKKFRQTKNYQFTVFLLWTVVCFFILIRKRTLDALMLFLDSLNALGGMLDLQVARGNFSNQVLERNKDFYKAPLPGLSVLQQFLGANLFSSPVFY